MKYKKQKKLLVLLLLLVCVIGIGYAALSANLTINGTANVSATTWDVHFDNVKVTEGCATTTEPTIGTDKVSASFETTLNNPGDFYEFTIDVVNEGSIDAMISELDLGSLEPDQEKYLNYSVTYSDGVSINENDLLSAGSTETLKVRIEFKSDIESSDLPTTGDKIEKEISITYVQNDGGVAVSHDPLVSFIVKAKAGNVTSSDLGTTFSVDLGTYGTHTLRVANTTTPSECSTTGFSQSACGVVLEFADIITTHNMNPSGTYNGIEYSYGWNKDGWPASSMYSFVNTDIYNALPETLRNSIIDTTTVSGHGSEDTTNFTSTDKLYLLSPHEVWENSTSNTIKYDTAWDNTRQLDYYSNIGVTTDSYSGAIKQNSGTNSYWWLRGAGSANTNDFFAVGGNGDWGNIDASSTRGVSPAFRIA